MTAAPRPCAVASSPEPALPQASPPSPSLPQDAHILPLSCQTSGPQLGWHGRQVQGFGLPQRGGRGGGGGGVSGGRAPVSDGQASGMLLNVLHSTAHTARTSMAKNRGPPNPEGAKAAPESGALAASSSTSHGE